MSGTIPLWDRARVCTGHDFIQVSLVRMPGFPGNPELGGRGAGANGGTGVSPSRGACLTTIFTTPVLFTMVGGTARGSYIEGKVEKKQETHENFKQM